jgi:hypothetical protein
VTPPDGTVLRIEKAAPVVLVIRDPDHSSEFVVDGEVEIIDVDRGSSFNGPKDLDPESTWGRERLARTRAKVKHLAADSEVRTAVERLCDGLEGARK